MYEACKTIKEYTEVEDETDALELSKSRCCVTEFHKVNSACIYIYLPYIYIDLWEDWCCWCQSCCSLWECYLFDGGTEETEWSWQIWGAEGMVQEYLRN